jgi:hypothetical protein
MLESVAFYEWAENWVFEEKKTEWAGKQEKARRNHSKGAHTAVTLTRRQECSAVQTSEWAVFGRDWTKRAAEIYSYYAETMFQFVAILFSETTTASNPKHIYDWYYYKTSDFSNGYLITCVYSGLSVMSLNHSSLLSNNGVRWHHIFTRCYCNYLVAVTSHRRCHTSLLLLRITAATTIQVISPGTIASKGSQQRPPD